MSIRSTQLSIDARYLARPPGKIGEKLPYFVISSFIGKKNQKCSIAMFLHLVGTEVSGDNCKITLLRIDQMILLRHNRFLHVC